MAQTLGALVAQTLLTPSAHPVVGSVAVQVLHSKTLTYDATASVASVTLTGPDAIAARLLAHEAAAGAIALTGPGASGVVSRAATASVASMTLTGSDATAARLLAHEASVAAVAVAGVDANGIVNRAATASAASVTLAGPDATADVTRGALASSGALDLTGFDATAVTVRSLSATSAALNIVGVDVTAAGLFGMTAIAAPMTLTGPDATGAVTRLSIAAPVAVNLSGGTADGVISTPPPASTMTLGSVSVQALMVGASHPSVSSVTVQVLTSADGGGSGGATYSLLGAQKQVFVNLGAASASKSASVVAATATIAISGSAAGGQIGYPVPAFADFGKVAVDFRAAWPIRSMICDAASSNVVVSGGDAAGQRGAVLGAGAVSVVGFDADAVVTRGADAELAQLRLDGGGAVGGRRILVDATPAAVDVSGADVSVARVRVLDAEQAGVTIQGGGGDVRREALAGLTSVEITPAPITMFRRVTMLAQSSEIVLDGAAASGTHTLTLSALTDRLRVRAPLVPVRVRRAVTAEVATIRIDPLTAGDAAYRRGVFADAAKVEIDPLGQYVIHKRVALGESATYTVLGGIGSRVTAGAKLSMIVRVSGVTSGWAFAPQRADVMVATPLTTVVDLIPATQMRVRGG